MSDSATAAERAFMARALELAARGLETTTPNPRVGAVIVRAGEIIGEGWHERAGGPHAEVAAIADAHRRGHDPRGATLYVTLEPCNHTGRTPPCTEAVQAAGIVRVVAAMADPNPPAAHGAQRLAAAGVAVAIGLMEAEARELNLGFVSRVTRGRPWVRLKSAASLDGRTALMSGESQWITGPEARADGHRFRARACAILTGIGTVRADDPQLTVRVVGSQSAAHADGSQRSLRADDPQSAARGAGAVRQPLKVIVDPDAQTPSGARVLAGGNALIVTAGARNPAWPAGVDVLPLPAQDGSASDGRIDLGRVLAALGARGINELHVEAGGRLSGALIAAGLVDELLLYVAPCLLGDPARGIAEFPGGLARLSDRVPLAIRSVDRIGEDLRVIARFDHGRFHQGVL